MPWKLTLGRRPKVNSLRSIFPGDERPLEEIHVIGNGCDIHPITQWLRGLRCRNFFSDAQCSNGQNSFLIDPGYWHAVADDDVASRLFSRVKLSDRVV